MVVAKDGLAFSGQHAGGTTPGGGLPIVFSLFDGDPWRQRLTQVVRQGVDVGLVHGTQLNELAIGFGRIAQLQAELRELGAQAKQFLRGKAILRQSARCCGENLGKINDRVARDRKCKLSLSGAGFLNAGYRQGAGVEYSGEGRDPGLVVMLGRKYASTG